MQSKAGSYVRRPPLPEGPDAARTAQRRPRSGRGNCLTRPPSTQAELSRPERGGGPPPLGDSVPVMSMSDRQQRSPAESDNSLLDPADLEI